MKKIIIAVGVVLFLFVGILFGGIKYNEYLQEKVMWNTTLNGQDISGLTREELESTIKYELEKLNGQTITLSWLDKKEAFKYSQLGISYKDNNLVEKIFGEQNNSIIENIKLGLERRKEVRNYELEPVFNEEILNQTIKTKLSEVIKEPQNASLQVKGDKVSIVGGENGIVLDTSNLKKDVLNAIKNGNHQVSVPTKEIEPEVTRKDIEAMGVKEIIASYQTTFDPSVEGRTNNIKLAAKAIDGTLLAPGDTFDFNGVVGPRTKKRGYKAAPVFMKGEVVEDIGGGICQVSSTLYNAVLYADLKVTERHNHGLPVSYVSAGRDATVSYGSLNFKFKNDTEHYIYIQMYTEGNKLYVRLFGTKPNKNKEVIIESEIIETIEPQITYIEDPNVPEGKQIVEKKGAKGYKSQTWKIIKENGQIVSRTKLSTDTYKAQKGIIRIPPKNTNIENSNE